MTKENPALEKFLETCRTEFQFLVTDYGFHESIGQKDRYSNPFKLCFVRDDLEICIEGIHYGFGAMVWISDKRLRKIGVRNLDPQFDPFDKKSVQDMNTATNQTDAIAEEVRLLIRYGKELLNGDFSVFERAFDRKSQALAEYEQRRAFGVAIQEAITAYDEGKWQVVVDLLEPHEVSLSKKMAKKLAFARTHV